MEPKRRRWRGHLILLLDEWVNVFASSKEGDDLDSNLRGDMKALETALTSNLLIRGEMIDASVGDVKASGDRGLCGQICLLRKKCTKITRHITYCNISKSNLFMCWIIQYLSKICQNVQLIFSNYKWCCNISVFNTINMKQTKNK